MSLAQENQELKARLAILEAQVAKLTPRQPEPERPAVKVTQSFWEIWSVCNGRRGGHPTCAPSLVRAQQEASYLARGDLLDNSGRRAPSKPIYELEPDEDLDDAIQRVGDGLFISKKTVDGSQTLNF
jgi:hypothetical protein